MFTTTQREQARQFLRGANAREVSVIETDIFKRTVYEIDLLENGTTPITEVWIEQESKLEEPEYFYNLFQFQGDPS